MLGWPPAALATAALLVEGMPGGGPTLVRPLRPQPFEER